MSKTIETHLQSNEVRIPKKATEFKLRGSVAAPPCQYFKSSFARSLSFSQGPGGGGGHGGGPYGSAEQHFTRSLDFDVNYDPLGGGAGSASRQMTPSSASPVYEEDADLGSGTDDCHDPLSLSGLNGSIAASNGGIVKTLWNYAKGQDIKPINGSPIKNAMGFKSHGSPGARKSIEGNEIEVLRLRKECQSLIEENRRLVNIATVAGGNGGAIYALGGMLNGGSGGAVGSGSLSTLGMGVPNGGSYSSVESVILQTQVETLQWQLKQVDSSRHMYRAVMEEVVRFLDRCYRSLDALQAASAQMGRSKSVLQVNSGKTGSQHPQSPQQQQHQQHQQHHHHDSDSSSASSPRARSSTNLIEAPKAYTKASGGGGKNGRLEQHQHQPSSLSLAGTALHEDDCVVPPSPASSYSTFRDFTWRRSPKRTQTLPISCNEVDPEKLAQEAFRLLRTVQNLLNTQEPTLAQSTNALDSLISSTAASSCGGSSTTLTGVGLSASSSLGVGVGGGVLGSSMPTLTGSSGSGSSSGGGSGPGAGSGSIGGAVTSSGGGVTNGTGDGGSDGRNQGTPAAALIMAGGLPVNTRSTVGFSRKLNMRGSRLSVRSSTADSVHSTSSSTKTETDEDSTAADRPSPPLLLSHHPHHHHLLANGHGGGGGGTGSMVNGSTGNNNGTGGGGTGGGGSSSSSSSCSSTSGTGGHHHHHHHHHHHRYSANIERIKEMMISSSAEDESGFSSMNSFQEIGLPLINSTMLSSVGSADSSSHGNGSLGSGSSSATDHGLASAGGGGTAGGTFDDSSELRENTTVIPINGTATAVAGGASGSANRLGIPASPAKVVTSVVTSSSVSGSPSKTTTTVVVNGSPVSSSGSPLRATQSSSYEHHTHFVNHRRWDSAPVVPPKLKIHASETDTVSRVLWV